MSLANTITITNPFGSSSCAAGTTSTFLLSSTGKNPTSVKDTGTYTITTYNTVNSVNYVVDTLTKTTGVYTPTAGSITQNLAVTSSSDVTYEEPVIYTIQFSPAHTIPQNGIIKLTIPISSIGIYSSSTLTSFSYIQTDGGTSQPISSISVSTVTGLVTISSAFQSGAWTPGTTGTKVKIYLDGLTNPTSLKQTQSF